MRETCWDWAASLWSPAAAELLTELGETVEVVLPAAETVAPEGMLTITWPCDRGTTEEFIPVGLLNKFWKGQICTMKPYPCPIHLQYYPIET